MWNGWKGDISDNNDEASLPMGKTIRARDDDWRRAEEGHRRLNVKAAFFYAYNGMVASTDPGWILSMFNILTGISNWVGLRKNAHKTVGVVCQPCRAAGVWADKAYT